MPPEVLSTVATTGSDVSDLPSNAALGAADRPEEGAEIVQATPSYFTNAAIAVTVTVLLGVTAVVGLAYLERLHRVRRGGIPNLKKRKRSGEDEEKDGGGNGEVKRGGTGGGGGSGVPVVSK